MISKESVLKDVKEKALLEAKFRMLDEYDAPDLVSEAEDIVEEFFCGITWTKVENNIIQSKDSVVEWHHRQLHEFESDWKYLEIDRSILHNSAERYLDRSWMQCNKMDWLILNTLTYAEYQGFVDTLRSKTLDIDDYVALKVGRKKSFSSMIWASLAFLLGWGLWLAVLWGLFEAWQPLGLAWAAFGGWGVWRKRAAKRKISDVQQSMSSTYSTFATISQSWAIVWEQLLSSRQKGVVWDGVVFRLVEERMNRTSQAVPHLSTPTGAL